MLSTIWMCTQEWSLMPSRLVALTAETCHQAFTWVSAFTAASNCSRRRLPRVGTRTRIAATASRGGMGGSRGGSRSAMRQLQQHALPQPSPDQLERYAEALVHSLEDQQSRGQQVHPLDVELEPFGNHCRRCPRQVLECGCERGAVEVVAGHAPQRRRAPSHRQGKLDARYVEPRELSPDVRPHRIELRHRWWIAAQVSVGQATRAELGRAEPLDSLRGAAHHELRG